MSTRSEVLDVRSMVTVADISSSLQLFASIRSSLTFGTRPLKPVEIEDAAPGADRLAGDGGGATDRCFGSELQHLDGTPNAWRVGEAPISGQQGVLHHLGEGDVASVVRAHVVPQFPHAMEEWCRREHGDRERPEVIECVVSLVVGQGSASVSPEHRHDFESEQIWPDERLAL